MRIKIVSAPGVCILASFSAFAQSSCQGNNTQRRQAVNSFEQRRLEEIEMMK
jgi:hypothetical protein